MKSISLFFLSFILCLSAQNVSAQWTPMGSGFNGPVRAIAVVGNTLYAAGKFTTSGSTTVNNVAKWNGTAWVALGTGTSNGVNDSVNALISFNGNLYIGGSFASVGGVSNTGYLAKWDVGTSTWSSVGVFDNTVRCLYNFNGSLIASGHFNAPHKNIAKLSGVNWIQVGTTSPAGAAYTMTTHYGELYIGGGWGSSPSIQYLDDTTNAWVNLPSGPSGEVKALASFKKSGQVQLYIGGNVTAGGIYKFCTYFSPSYGQPPFFGSGSGGDYNCLYTNSTHMYVGGGFSFVSNFINMSMLARYYVGHAPWTAFDNDVNNFNSEVLSLGEYNNRLIAGGRFTQVGSTTVNYISQSSALTSTEDQSDNIVMNEFYPNPMTNNATLEIETKNIMSNPSLTLFDMIGKEMNIGVSERIFDGGATHVEFSINSANLSQGIYYYSVSDKGATIATGKIVVE